MLMEATGSSMPELDPLRWKALAVICAAFFMTILDVSIVNVALPSIGKSLDFSRENLQWVLTAYAITFGGFLLLGGRAADLFGRRRVFLVGVVVFTVASLVCGLASSEGMLIGARAVQGLGAAIISPAALSIVMTTFEEGAERNKALGIWGALGGAGAAVGVLAGRRPDQVPRLGVDLLRQRPGRRARVRARAAVRAREPLGAPDLAGRRRRRDGHGGTRAARLRDLAGARPRLELRAGRSCASWPRPCCSSRSSSSRPGRSTR